MRGIAAVGMVLGLVMMTGPLWLPRLGFGAVGPLSLAAPGLSQAMPQSPGAPLVTRPEGAGPVGSVFSGISAALQRAGGMVGAPVGELQDAGSGWGAPGAPAMRTTGDPAAAMAQVCAVIVAQGRMSEKDCRSQMGTAIAAAGGPAPAMGEVERAMQGNRNFGTVMASKKHPGAKFVRVDN